MTSTSRNKSNNSAYCSTVLPFAGKSLPHYAHLTCAVSIQARAHTHVLFLNRHEKLSQALQGLLTCYDNCNSIVAAAAAP